ncbi:MAG: hypothetical protein GF355_02660 [Candidatus Eisenbacteria bacterium]|nr:hypothetical protein [Candidatus Eisenbacteria bacterium]
MGSNHDEPIDPWRCEMILKSRLLLLCLVLAGALTASVQADTWHVFADGSGDAPTIQAAADSAAQGDTVLVHPGTYYESIYLYEKGVILKSQVGPEDTILDGSTTPDYVVYFDSVANATIEGFTIMNGTGGGDRGIVINGAGLSIRDNILRESFTVSGGAGIQWLGSGIIEGNLFIDNEAEQGAGIYTGTSEGPVTIRGNTFIGNRASYRGGALYSGCDETVVEENLFLANESPMGSGIYNDDPIGVVRNNTFYGNIGSGGAITFRIISEADIERNIIAGTVGGYALECEPGDGFFPTPHFLCNAFWDNDMGTATGAGCVEVFYHPGNFEANPLFCDPETQDFRLSENSPCAPGNHPEGDPCGLIGAFDVGCEPVPVRARKSWGALKSLYGTEK